VADHSFVKILLLSLLIVVAAALRLVGLNWDGGVGAHPDERYVVGVAERLRWADRLNPFDVAPGFAYGHLPLYLLMLVGELARDVDLLLAARALAALFDLGTVVLTFALGWRVYADDADRSDRSHLGDKVGLLAAAFVALMVLHVQQAHFYTVDALLAFFALGTLLFAVRLAERGRSLDAWLAGVWAGLALGTKFSAGLLVVPLGAALATYPTRAISGRSWSGRGPNARLRRGLECGVAALAAFALTNPFALSEFSTFWHNVGEQSSIVRGVLDVPYTRQFHGTWPYLYPIVQQLRWGMGWPLGLIACGGCVYAVWQAVRGPSRRAEWVLLTWMVPGCSFVGALYVKFPRYLLPLTPVLALYAARLLSVLHRRNRCLSVSLACLSLLYSFLCCLSFVNLYRVPHPWQTASAWFYDHAPRGAVVAVEQWDHPLPLDGTGYRVLELPIFDEDTGDDALEKWEKMTQVLAETDYLVIASRRGYATLARWPERYPLTSRYYRQLFEGELNFEAVACFGRYPRLGPLTLADDPTADLGFSLPELCQPGASGVLHLGRLDESLVVYDHPQVVIWRRVP
jgi:4-amino-4-deoxy-L-arabinose transferase-like glycosyltransferase